MSQTTETPAETLEAATNENALPHSRLALLGTIIKPDTATALVRLGSDTVQSVTIGDEIGGAQVVAIEEGELYLEQHGRARKLTLPGD